MTPTRPVSRSLAAPFRESDAGYSLVELLAFMAVVVTTAAFVLPFTRSTLNAMNLTSDARKVSSVVSLAKMRAASFFTQARIHADLNARTFRVERWKKTAPAGWVTEGKVETLSPTVNFGFSNLAAPPPNTQAVLGQAPQCNNDMGNPIANTACIVFNSRGIPINDMNTPTTTGALYVNDGAVVYGVTTAAGGHVRLWRSNIIGGAAWTLH